MNFLMIPFFFIFILLGFANMMYPESMLRFGDYFKIRGERQYTDFAITMTRIGGFLIIVFSFIMLFSGVF